VQISIINEPLTRALAKAIKTVVGWFDHQIVYMLHRLTI